MSFVPVVVTSPPPSPQARELGRRLTDTIDRFSEENPSVSPAEIQQALSLATPSSSRGAGRSGALVGALLVGLLIFGLLAYFYVS